MASSDDLRQLNRHLAALRVQTRCVPLGRILHDQPIACVDGRKQEGIVGAPGGNAGLFLLLLTAYERFRATRLSDADVSGLFIAYLDRFGHFYLHSDTGALARLFEALAAAPQADRPESAAERIAYLHQPPQSARAVLRQLLARPAHLGCGHLRLTAEHPERYHARPELFAAFLRAYFDALWAGDDRIVFDVLDGALDARAVLNIHTEDDPQTAVPLPCPRFQSVQLFVHHPSAVAFLRSRHAAFLADRGWIDASDAEAFAAAHARLEVTQLEDTLKALAPGLPHLDVHATPAGELRLSGTGAAW